MDKSYTTSDHLDDLHIAHCILSRCETLFAAITDIERLENTETLKLKRIRGLAEIGALISLEWSDQYDCFHKDLKNFMDSRGGAK